MSNDSHLSRRERQIMDVVFSRGEATVLQITEALPDPPTSMAVRRMLHILVRKGHLKGRTEGREVVYLPAQSKAKAGLKAFQHVLDTFFGGALDEALAAHLLRKESLTPAQLKRLEALIDQAREGGQ